MGEPLMDQYAKISAYDVHSFQVRCTMGAGTAMTYRSRDAIPTRPSATTLTVTFPKPYAEVVGFTAARFAAAGVAGLEWILTTITTDSNGGITALTFTSIVTGGTATASAASDVVYLDIKMSCDTLNDRFTG